MIKAIDNHLPVWWWCHANPVWCILQDIDYWLHYKRLHTRRKLGWQWISNGKWGSVSARIGNLHSDGIQAWYHKHHPEYFED